MEEKKEYLEKGAKPFSDERGRIDNYFIEPGANWIGMITSNSKGIVRANHYHPEQTQKVLCVSGSYISVSKDRTYQDAPIRDMLVQAGDLVTTPPNVTHAMIFREKSTIINLVSGEREHENFGQHTIKEELVSEEDVIRYLEKYSGSDSNEQNI